MTARPTPLTLADLPRIVVGRVVEVCGGGPAAERLLELGFSPGTEVRFERQAPFGGPLIVSLRGYQLSLRVGDARNVCIEAIGGRS